MNKYYYDYTKDAVAQTRIYVSWLLLLYYIASIFSCEWDCDYTGIMLAFEMFYLCKDRTDCNTSDLAFILAPFFLFCCFFVC